MNQFSGGAAEVEERNASVLQNEMLLQPAWSRCLQDAFFLPQLSSSQRNKQGNIFARNHPFKQHCEQIALIFINAPLLECWGGQPGRALSHEVIYKAPRQ